MSIVNVNTIQYLSGAGPEQLQTFTDTYLKESLANLGQRFSIKGDGIATGSFGLWELFTTLPEPVEADFAEGGSLYSAYISAQVIPSLEDNDTRVFISAHNVNGVDKTIELSNDNYIILEDDEYISGVKPHAANSSIISYIGLGSEIIDNITDISFATKEYDANGNLQEITVETFNDVHPYIQSSLKIYIDNEEHVRAAYIKFIKGEGVSQPSHFVLKTFTTNIELLEDFEEMLFADETGICRTSRTWTGASVFELLQEYLITDETINSVTYDEDTEWLKVDSDDNVSQNSELAILSYNEDITILRPFILSLFNDESYFSDNANLKLKQRITAEILTKLYDTFVKESDGDNARTAVFNAYFPYDYQIAYYCNSNDKSQILSSVKPITVEATPDAEGNMWKIMECGTERVRQQLCICSTYDITASTENIFSTWEFVITYTEEGLLDQIIVNRIYTLPYINDEGYWNISGIDTDIYARGKDGGQPSLIVTYTDTYNGTCEVLSSLNHDQLAYLVDWDVQEYRVRPLDTMTNVGNATYHMMNAYLPVPPSYMVENYENMFEFLKSAIIMNVNSVNSEITSYAYSVGLQPLAHPDQLGPDSTITTFWSFQRNPVTKEYEFTYLKQPSTDWAIDFNYLTNAEAIVKHYLSWAMEPDRYHFSWLVYDRVSGTLKNQAQAGSQNWAYPVLMNRYVDGVSDVLYTEGDIEKIYRNNANFVPAFQTQVTHYNSYITGVEPSNLRKFFYLDDNGYLPMDGDDPCVAQAVGLDELPVTEWYPNTTLTNIDNYLSSLLPILDLKEMFVRNINTLNRYNILSTDENGRMWYSYIGTSYEDIDKSVLHFGTGNTDINIGLQTMTDDEIRQRFTRTPKLDIDFDTIAENGDVLFTKGWWEVYYDGDTRTYSRKIQLSYANPVEQVIQLQDAHDMPYFTMREIYCPGNSDIGLGIEVEKNYTYFSYVNITKLIEDYVYIPGFDRNTSYISGDAQALQEFTYDYWINYDHFEENIHVLKLESDIQDRSQMVENDIVCAGTLQLSYHYSDNGIAYINVKEIPSTSASAMAHYYGGEL